MRDLFIGRGGSSHMSELYNDRLSLLLLLFILLFILLHPFIEGSPTCDLILLLLVYLTLTTATVKLHEKGVFGRIALLLVLPSMLGTLAGQIHPTRTLMIVD